MVKYSARSASDDTDDWPYWMVWDGHVNCTAPVMDQLGLARPPGAVFGSRPQIEQIVLMANEKFK
jgi:hypothetical protein